MVGVVLSSASQQPFPMFMNKLIQGFAMKGTVFDPVSRANHPDFTNLFWTLYQTVSTPHAIVELWLQANHLLIP